MNPENMVRPASRYKVFIALSLGAKQNLCSKLKAASFDKRYVLHFFSRRLYKMIASKILQLFWFTIQQFDDATIISINLFTVG